MKQEVTELVPEGVPVEVESVGQAQNEQSPKRYGWGVALLLVGILLAAGLYALLTGYQGVGGGKKGKVYRVGILSGLEYFYPMAVAFQDEMARLGYIEGKNISYEVQKAPAPVGNQALLQKFVDERVDLMVVFPTEVSLEAKEVTQGRGIPVISLAAFVEGNGLIESIQHPGTNVSGVRFPVGEVVVKRLELLHEIAPKVKRVWVPYLKDYPTVETALSALKPAAKEMGMVITGEPFSSPDEMAAYFAKLSGGNIGMEAILLVAEPISITPAFVDQIYVFADAQRLPLAGVSVTETEAGPIFGLVPTVVDFGRLAAPLADKLLTGVAMPGSLPIVTPGNDLEINYKAVKRLGLTVDEGLLSTAKRVVR